MMKWKLAPVLLLGLALTLALGTCKRSQSPAPQPKELTREAVSVDDGMILVDFPGPKGQLHRPDGSIEYFCETTGMLAALRDPARGQRVAAAFVQAFDDRPWGSFKDGWVPVADPYFVMGSDRMGAMGPTLVPFRERAKAEAFAKEHGGAILRFDEITAQRLDEFAKSVREKFTQRNPGQMAPGQEGPGMQGTMPMGPGRSPHAGMGPATPGAASSRSGDNCCSAAR